MYPSSGHSLPDFHKAISRILSSIITFSYIPAYAPSKHSYEPSGSLAGASYTLSYACSFPAVKQSVNAAPGSLAGFSYACSIPPVKQPINAASGSLAGFSYACSIPPVKQSVNAASESLTGASYAFSYACSIPPVKQSVNAASESLTGASYAFSYACSIPPVKQSVNAAFGSLLICLCRIWEDGSPQYSRECQQGSAHVFTAWHTRCRLDSDDAEQGQQYPPQGGKKQGVKGGAAPPCKIT